MEQSTTDGPHTKIELPSEEQITSIKERLQSSHIDAISVLGGGYKKVPLQTIDGSPVGFTANLSSYDSSRSGYPDRISAVKARAIAAKELWEEIPGAVIVTLGRTKPDSDPSEADVSQEYITRGESIPQGQLIKNQLPTATITELMELIEMSVNNNWKTVAVVTNDWHWKRVETMYSFLTDTEKRQKLFTMLRNSVVEQPNTDQENPLLQNLNRVLQYFAEKAELFAAEKRNLIIVPAEPILEDREERYKKIIDIAHSPDAEVRITPEQRNRLDKEGVAYKIVDKTLDANGTVLVTTSRLENQLRTEGKGTHDLLSGKYRAGKPGDPNNLLVKYVNRKMEQLDTHQA